jgi:predicted pyridoxine 5'-phosphate oxidase superfamily flavin-nucleotide-binding protein
MDDEIEKYKAEINITVEVTSETVDRQSLQRALYKAKAEINITVEVTSETVDRQSLQRALYKAGGGMAAAMCDYLTAELASQLGQPGQDYDVSIHRLVWN